MKKNFFSYNNNMLDVRKVLGYRIKESRKSQHMTQAELAFAVGVDPKYISRIETGISYPSLSVIEKIFNILNINMIIQTSSSNKFIQVDETERKILLQMINNELQNTSIKNIKMVKDIVKTITTSNL